MKYKLTENKKERNGRTLFQIESLIDFGSVKAGDLGGWIEKESNLSQVGDAWVYNNARVYGNARVYNNARVSGNAEVSGDAEVYGNAEVSGDARVYGDAWLYGNARVYGNADIIWISKIGSRLDTTTAFRCKNGDIKISCGCFFGTIEDFAEAVKSKHGDSKFGKEYNLLIELIKIHFEDKNYK